MLTPSRRPQQQQVARSRRRSGPRAKVTEIPTWANECINDPTISIDTYRSKPSTIPLSISTVTNLRFFPLSIVKDKANHAVVLDKATSEKLYKDVQSYRLITVATLVDRLKINGSLARQALSDLEEKGQIKKVVGHSKMNIYSMWFCTLLH